MLKALKFIIPSVVLVAALVAAGVAFIGKGKVAGVFSEKPPNADAAVPVDLSPYFFDEPPADFTVYRQKPVVVKGIYVTGTRAGLSSYMDPLIELCDATALNAMVIDVKTDDGTVTFKGIPAADEAGISEGYIPDIQATLAKLKEHNIYAIARVVCFKDNGAKDARPELYIKNKDGSLWRDKRSGSSWLNPYNKQSWEYIAEIAKGAARLGFNEIQLDYIRFNEERSLSDADMGDTGGKSRAEIIADFAAYMKEQLAGYDVFLGADVYGIVIGSKLDADTIGQDYRELSKRLDYICPMVYPSHYADGSFGIAHPDLEPYNLIKNAMDLSNEVLADVPEHAVVRPWLQDFTAPWIHPHLDYGPKETREQIQAAYDAGMNQFMMWDAGVNYDPAAFEKE
ncbi:MAG: putative glycoside hydrolase [Clostridiales bacterium]|jgi:hypothetical protein|nr:putative glycoside hydrolase [Clostridiales bacterium]